MLEKSQTYDTVTAVVFFESIHFLNPLVYSGASTCRQIDPPTASGSKPNGCNAPMFLFFSFLVMLMLAWLCKVLYTRRRKQLHDGKLVQLTSAPTVLPTNQNQISDEILLSWKKYVLNKNTGFTSLAKNCIVIIKRALEKNQFEWDFQAANVLSNPFSISV